MKVLRGTLCTTLCWAALGGCAEAPYEPTADPRLQLSVYSGDEQIATAESTLPLPLAVRATDGNGHAVRGVPIHWSVTEPGGTVVKDSVTSVTDAEGLASVQRRLGSLAGEYITTASPAGAPERTIRLRSIALVQGATRIRLHPDEPVQRTDTALSAFAARVAVVDHLDQPVPGVRVSWEIGEWGSLRSGTSTSDEHGLVRVPVTLGARLGLFSVRAWVTGLEGSPVVFGGSVVAGNPVRLAIVTGDGQYGLEHSAVRPYVVRADDANGNAVAGVPITWRVLSGGGLVAPAQAATVSEVVWGGPRVAASATHTLGSRQEPQVVTATAGIAGAPSVTFTSVAVFGGAFTPATPPAVAYERTAPHSHPLGILSRYVLFDNGTFTLQYLRPDVQFGEYRGRYARADSLITFDFDDWNSAGAWQATGVVHGDSIVVAYNIVMSLADFEDGVYVRRSP